MTISTELADTEKGNPRGAALRHAARATTTNLVHEQGSGLVPGTDITDVSDVTNTIATGLVYVGDQLRRANWLAEYQLIAGRIRSAGAEEDRAELEEHLLELAELLWP